MNDYIILVPIDFSKCARAALVAATKIAQARPSATIITLHVDPGIVPTYDDELGELAPMRWYHRLRLQVEERHAKSSAPIEEIVAHGEPVAEIVKKASELDADLIVIGTHGRTGLSRLVLGSVTEGVLRNAPCPVLCVRPGKTSYDCTAAIAELGRNR